MEELVITTVDIYRDIAIEAYETMCETIGRDTTPIPGSSGVIKKVDLKYTSFKYAMFTIVFTGIWLKANTHLLIVQTFGKNKFKDYDFKPYEERLKALGIQDSTVLSRVKNFRNDRRELVHEKAFLDKGIRIAQKEAKRTFHLLCVLEPLLIKKGKGITFPGDK